MSNPAVIPFAAFSGDGIKRFVIEDNIGESIHIHADNVRVDLTINDFNDLAVSLKAALREMLLRKGLDIDLLDEGFLVDTAHVWVNLESAKTYRMRLTSLRCSVYYPRFWPLHRRLAVTNTPAFKYLSGDTAPYIKYCRDSNNSFGEPTRLDSLALSIAEHGYDDSKRPIVIFNSRPLIMDGQHRAACLAQDDPDREVLVLDLKFSRKFELAISLKWVARHFAKLAKHFVRRRFIILSARIRLFFRRFSSG